ncbi:PREDICTED: waprin-Phi1-like isoform X2 [Corvus brachyrhynchos]|uniref:waprin-Phi1-like isoform X2 n=1 Tax=Corvus brachyrhynchos TaxID=85066 RepID=UPI0008166842|nr:PREDICTED: waprin-Phi1-like isoform X2 [Corvus brachyrhynchos]
MELPPGCLLLLAALLPLAKRSSPAPHATGREELGMTKPGYCYHIPEVEDLLDKDCGSRPTGAPRDADCHGVTKCCPSKCGYTCQEPVLDFCYLPSVCGNCKALFQKKMPPASSARSSSTVAAAATGTTSRPRASASRPVPTSVTSNVLWAMGHRWRLLLAPLLMPHLSVPGAW